MFLLTKPSAPSAAPTVYVMSAAKWHTVNCEAAAVSGVEKAACLPSPKALCSSRIRRESSGCVFDTDWLLSSVRIETLPSISSRTSRLSLKAASSTATPSNLNSACTRVTASLMKSCCSRSLAKLISSCSKPLTAKCSIPKMSSRPTWLGSGSGLGLG